MAVVTPQSETKVLGRVLSATAHKYVNEIRDSAFENHATWGTIAGAPGVRQSWMGGAKIQAPVNLVVQGTAGSYQGYDTFDTTPSNTRTAALFDSKESIASIVVSQRDLDNMRSPEAVANLLQVETDLQMQELLRDLNLQAMNDGTGNSSKDIGGILAFAPEDPTSDTYGGISSSSNSNWRNQYLDNGNSTADTLADMRTVYTNCTFGSRRPNFIITSRTVRNVYESKLTATLRVDPLVISDNKEGNARVERLRFGAAQIVVDGDFVAGSNGTTNWLAMLNTDSLKLYTKQGADFSVGEFTSPQNQTVLVAPIRWHGALVCTERRLNGNLFDISAT